MICFFFFYGIGVIRGKLSKNVNVFWKNQKKKNNNKQSGDPKKSDFHLFLKIYFPESV